MYNLLESSLNYSDKTLSFWFSSKDEAQDFDAHIVNVNNLKWFKYKAKLLANTVT